MNRDEIVAAIKKALGEAGIEAPFVFYDDSGSLVSVAPKENWIDGLGGSCFVCIYADRVQNWQHDTTYNHTRGFPVGQPTPYSTVAEMVAAVRKHMAAPKAACWN